MTKEQKIEAYAMRLTGYSLRECAQKFGVSYQYIQQMFPGINNHAATLAMRCIYKGLSEYIKDNGISLRVLSNLIDAGLNLTTIRNRLRGMSEFTITEIRALLDYTGLTFEECFALKNGAVENKNRRGGGRKKEGETDGEETEEPTD